MVLQARQNHRALSEAHRQFRARDGFQMLSSSEPTSSFNYDDDEGIIADPASTAGLEFPSTTSTPLVPTNASIQSPGAPSAPKPKERRHKPMVDKKRKKDEKGRKTKNKKQRRANEDPNRAYKYDTEDEDEQTARKKGKKSTVTIKNREWKAMTRAAAKRQMQ